MQKKVLLAIGNDKFNNLLRKPLSEHFQVLSEEVYSRKYLEEFIKEHDPNIIIVHDYFLSSEKKDEFEMEVEWLQLVERIRMEYDDQKRIVFICERSQGDPFLSELVNRNVLDIFHSRSLDINNIIEQLKDVPRYSKVSYLMVEGSGKHYKSVGASLFSYNEELEKEQSIQSPITEISSDTEEKQEVSILPETSKKFKKINFPSFKKENPKTKQVVEPEDEVNEMQTITRRESVKESRKDRKPFFKKEISPNDSEKDESLKKKSLFNLFSNNGNGSSKSSNNNQSKGADYQLGTFPPKLIAVGSLHPGAGSTFFLYNFTRYLSDVGVPSAVLESLNDMDALFALVGSESPPNFDWESIHNTILMNRNSHYLYSIPKWTIERTIFIPTLDVPKNEFKSEHAKELLYFARQSPIVFVDISHNWTNPIAQEALAMCDELWCVTEPNPMYIELQSEKHHQEIFQVSSRVGEDKIIVIGNKWGSGLDVERFPEIHARIPYIPENIKAMSSSVPVYRQKPKSFTEFNRLYDKLILD